MLFVFFSYFSRIYHKRNLAHRQLFSAFQYSKRPKYFGKYWNTVDGHFGMTLSIQCKWIVSSWWQLSASINKNQSTTEPCFQSKVSSSVKFFVIFCKAFWKQSAVDLKMWLLLCNFLVCYCCCSLCYSYLLHHSFAVRQMSNFAGMLKVKFTVNICTNTCTYCSAMHVKVAWIDHKPFFITVFLKVLKVPFIFKHTNIHINSQIYLHTLGIQLTPLFEQLHFQSGSSQGRLTRVLSSI